jgi:vitellogenic carboxypeptidase-like protein
MVYSGQLDVIVAFPQTESFLNALDWSGKYIYALAPRKIWKVDSEVAGYVREAKNLIQVMVRNAGHILPYDQPKWAFDMIQRFVQGKAFA